MDISLIQFILFASVGACAGVLNAIAGGGTYLTFPVLIFAGLTPALANTTNKVGIWFGSLGSAGGYSNLIRQHKSKLLVTVLSISIIGSIAGSYAALVLPTTLFKAAVPWLMLIATILFTFGRHIARLGSRLAMHRHTSTIASLSTCLSLFVITAYGGFFGAGMAFMLLALFELAGIQSIHQSNGLKILVSAAVNAVSALIFISTGAVDWFAAVALMGGALAGGFCGARVAKRLPEWWVRWFIITFSSVVTLWFFIRL